MELTKEERTVIADLLATYAISDYEIVLDAPEGSMPPESPFGRLVHKWSGYVVTPSTAYSFWLDWYEGHYTLGHEDGYWEEETDLNSLVFARKIFEQIRHQPQQKKAL